MTADLNEAEYQLYQMICFLEWGITPEKLNEEPVLYREDIIDIMEAKKLIARGQLKLRKRAESEQRSRTRSRRSSK